MALVELLIDLLTKLFALISFIWSLTFGRILSSPRGQNGPLVLSAPPGGRAPQFFNGTYQEAFKRAREDNKFLLVYLHSKIHQDTPRFCRDVLCKESVSWFLEENFVLWGGDVSSPEGYYVSNTKLRPTMYPFFAVVTHVTNSQTMMGYLRSLNYNNRFVGSGTTLLFKLQGYVSDEQLIQALTKVLEDHAPLLIAAKSEKEDRERERQLVRSQDEEFIESLELDMEKEKMKLIEEENRKKEELKLKEEQDLEFKRKKEEALLEEQRRLEEVEKVEKLRKLEEQKKLAEGLPPQPEKSQFTADIRIRLTDGSVVMRRFLASDPIDYIFRFVATQEIIENKVLSTQFPRKSYSYGDTTSLKEAQLAPSGNIFVEEQIL